MDVRASVMVINLKNGIDRVRISAEATYIYFTLMPFEKVWIHFSLDSFQLPVISMDMQTSVMVISLQKRN